MDRPRSRVPAFGFLTFTPRTLGIVLLAAACSGGAEQAIVTQFFTASRLRDNTSLDNIATVVFDPQTQGTVSSLSIQSIGPEERKPLPLKSLAQAQESARAEDAAFTRRKDEYQNANLDAIQRVIKAERSQGKVGGKDVVVQATWTKLREESATMSKKVSDARRALRAETQLADLSVNAGGRTPIDVTKYDGETASKEVVVVAPVRLPSGETTKKTLVLTLQRAMLKGDKEIAGRWIVTRIQERT